MQGWTAGVGYDKDILLQPLGANVGIGITAPTEKLHVGGNGLFSGTVTANTVFQSSDSLVQLAPTGAGNIQLRPNGVASATGQVQIEPTGRVTAGGYGIGAFIDAAPAYLLGVESNGRVKEVNTSSFSGTVSGSGVHHQVAKFSAGGTDIEGSIIYATGAGFVGMGGITAPVQALEVGGSGIAASSGFGYTLGVSTETPIGSWSNVGGKNRFSGGTVLAPNTRDFEFFNGTNVVMHLDMFTERVGIGTDTPTTMLEIKNADDPSVISMKLHNSNATTILASSRIWVQSNQGEAYTHYQRDLNAANWSTGVDNDGVDAFTIANGVTLNDDKFRIFSTGAINVSSYGSGTITGTPTYTLNVDASGNIIEGAVSGSDVPLTITTITAVTAALTTDNTLLDATTNAVDLQPVVANLIVGKRYIVKAINTTNAVTITPTSGTIDGQASYTLPAAYDGVILFTDGTNIYLA